MNFSNKLMLGGAALLIATAASFPQELGDRYLGTYPQDIRKREALKVCQEHEPGVRALLRQRPRGVLYPHAGRRRARQL